MLRGEGGERTLSASFPPDRWVLVDDTVLAVLPVGAGPADFAVTARQVVALPPATANADCPSAAAPPATTALCGTTRTGAPVRVTVRADPRNPANVVLTVIFE
jgi:hypothetical protein